MMALLAGCAGDADIDAHADALNELPGALERARIAEVPVVPLEVWRVAPACGEVLPARGVLLPVAGERGLMAWAAPDLRVHCVDSALRFRSEGNVRSEPDPQPMTPVDPE